MKRLLLALIITLATGTLIQAHAATYKIDTDGAHAFIQFKTPHLGYSWLLGRFNTFDGTFNYDPDNLEESDVSVTIQTGSIDSNHAERDKHLRAPEFLDTAQYPEAKFVSTSIEKTGEDTAIIRGDFTLRGVTKPIEIDAKFVGEGEDPWGGYRAGFTGTTTIDATDYGVKAMSGKTTMVAIELYVEGIRQ